MSVQKPSLPELVATPDGKRGCPKCGEAFEDMDAWIGHVSVDHDVYREFVQRWTRPEE